MTEGPHGYKQIAYAPYVAILNEAIKELKVENDRLQSQLDDLQARVDQLERKSAGGQ